MAHGILSSKNLGYDLLREQLTLTQDEKKWFEGVYASYLSGDFWQKNGQSTLLPPSEGSSKSTIELIFSKRYVTRNVLREVVNRVSSVFFSRSPNWYLTRDGKPIKTTETLKQLLMVLNKLWTEQNFSKMMQDAVNKRLASGRGSLRVFVWKKQQSKIFQKLTSLSDALNLMRIESPDPKVSRMLDEVGDLISILSGSRRVNWDSDTNQDFVEFSFVDDNGMTFIGLVTSEDSAKGLQSLIQTDSLSEPLDLGGRTVLFEISGEPFLNNAMFENNQLLNLALTCCGFNLVENGFGEMVVTNVALDTEKVPDVRSETGYREVPKGIKRGGGVVNNFVGLDTVNLETGNEQVMKPDVYFKDPSPVTPFVEGKELAYSVILEEAHQKFALITGDSVASGISRIQAMADFWLNICHYKAEVDRLGSWLLTILLRYASVLSNDTTYSDLSIVFDSKVYLGPLSSEERKLVIELQEKGFISTDTANVMLGVENSEEERELVVQENLLFPLDSKDKTTTFDFAKRVELANAASDLLSTTELLRILYPFKTEAEIAAIKKEIQEDNPVLQAMKDGNNPLDGQGNPDNSGEPNNPSDDV